MVVLLDPVPGDVLPEAEDPEVMAELLLWVPVVEEGGLLDPLPEVLPDVVEMGNVGELLL